MSHEKQHVPCSPVTVLDYITGRLRRHRCCHGDQIKFRFNIYIYFFLNPLMKQSDKVGAITISSKRHFLMSLNDAITSLCLNEP